MQSKMRFYPKPTSRPQTFKIFAENCMKFILARWRVVLCFCIRFSNFYCIWLIRAEGNVFFSQAVAFVKFYNFAVNFVRSQNGLGKDRILYISCIDMIETFSCISFIYTSKSLRKTPRINYQRNPVCSRQFTEHFSIPRFETDDIWVFFIVFSFLFNIIDCNTFRDWSVHVHIDWNALSFYFTKWWGGNKDVNGVDAGTSRTIAITIVINRSQLR